MNLATAGRSAVGIPGDLKRSVRGPPTSASTYLVTRRSHVRIAGWSSAALASMLRHLPGAPDAFTPDELEQLVAFATDGTSSVGTYAQRSSNVTSVGTPKLGIDSGAYWAGNARDGWASVLDRDVRLIGPAVGVGDGFERGGFPFDVLIHHVTPFRVKLQT